MNKKILVVDDDDSIVDAIKMILESTGYSVEAMTDGKKVYSLKNNLPDLILLDILMAGADGRELARYLKNNNQTTHIPIIMMSANRDVEKIINLEEVNGYLSKPFDMQELLDIVQRTLTPVTAKK